MGTYPGSPADEDFEEIRLTLEQASPDVVLVAYGAPRQDQWINKHRLQFPGSVRVAMGVGGVFDYLSGRVPLAPPHMRRLGLEWLYRLIKTAVAVETHPASVSVWHNSYVDGRW